MSSVSNGGEYTLRYVGKPWLDTTEDAAAPQVNDLQEQEQAAGYTEQSPTAALDDNDVGDEDETKGVSNNRWDDADDVLDELEEESIG